MTQKDKKRNNSKVIKSYKGFDKDLKCRDFQYEIGKEYEQPVVKDCESGFYACENPLDVLNSFPSKSRFCEVEQSGEIKTKESSDSTVISTKIKIGTEIGFGLLYCTGRIWQMQRQWRIPINRC